MISNFQHQTVRFLSMLHSATLRFSTMRLPSSNSLSSPRSQQRLVTASADFSFPPPAKQHPWLVVGLGNPGKKYDGTRHNVGFEMIDAIAEAEGITLSTVQHKALTGKGKIGSAHVLLAKPQTYVNLSGDSVGPMAAYYRIPIQQILVIFDDMDLEFAVMRLLPKGGHGGHNGMKSLIQHLKGSRDFPRLRIGIGRPRGRMDPAAFVLQKFNKSEREEMDVSIARGIDAVRQVTTEGIEKAASTWNEVRKSRMKFTEKEANILRQI